MNKISSVLLLAGFVLATLAAPALADDDDHDHDGYQSHHHHHGHERYNTDYGNTGYPNGTYTPGFGQTPQFSSNTGGNGSGRSCGAGGTWGNNAGVGFDSGTGGSWGNRGAAGLGNGGGWGNGAGSAWRNGLGGAFGNGAGGNGWPGSSQNNRSAWNGQSNYNGQKHHCSKNNQFGNNPYSPYGTAVNTNAYGNVVSPVVPPRTNAAFVWAQSREGGYYETGGRVPNVINGAELYRYGGTFNDGRPVPSTPVKTNASGHCL